MNWPGRTHSETKVAALLVGILAAAVVAGLFRTNRSLGPPAGLSSTAADSRVTLSLATIRTVTAGQGTEYPQVPLAMTGLFSLYLLVWFLAFVSGQTVSLYVVNSSGEVNANGFPVTVAVGSTPRAPTGLRIVG